MFWPLSTYNIVDNIQRYGATSYREIRHAYRRLLNVSHRGSRMPSQRSWSADVPHLLSFRLPAEFCPSADHWWTVSVNKIKDFHFLSNWISNYYFKIINKISVSVNKIKDFIFLSNWISNYYFKISPYIYCTKFHFVRYQTNICWCIHITFSLTRNWIEFLS